VVFFKNGNDRDWERYWGCGDLHPRPGQNGKEKAEKRKRSKESQKDQGQWVTAIPVQRRLVQGSPDRADKKGLLPSPEVRLVQESPKKTRRAQSMRVQKKKRGETKAGSSFGRAAVWRKSNRVAQKIALTNFGDQ